MSVLVALAWAVPPTTVPLPVDRELTVLGPGTPTEQLADAAARMGDWEVELAGKPLNGAVLTELAAPPPGVHPVRHVRETLGRAVDPEDLVYFLDDVLAAEARRGERFHVHVGRARNHGIVLHPDDVFRGRPRRYPRKSTLAVDIPKPQTAIDTPAPDGAPPGPDWTARYRNPADREEMLAALRAERPDATFADRIDDLLTQLEAQGAEVYLASTTRYRERGYLMWGAFHLSRAKDQAELESRLAVVDARNAEWGLDVPIDWDGAGDWQATRDAARQMADTYDVVYATEKGARSSNHYGAKAADLIAIDLPRRLTLTAPDGATRSFLLTADDESRDLSLTPRLIDWLEAHWGMRKLRSDYPHWTDTE
jgi:hypothetical protein